MRVLLSLYGWYGGVEPHAGLAAQLRAHGAAVRVWAPPNEVRNPLAMRGVIPFGGWR